MDGMGGVGGGSWAGRQPLLSASIRKPRGDMGAGQDTRNSGAGEEEGEGVGTGRRSLACHSPALKSIPRHLPSFPSPSALDADV